MTPRPSPVVVLPPGLPLREYVAEACAALTTLRLTDAASVMRRLAHRERWGRLATHTDRLLTVLEGASAMAAAVRSPEWIRHAGDTRRTLLALAQRLDAADRAAASPRFERGA